ncbi:MAG: hypothetical protein ABSC95_04020 [Acetobacteraceae bacterium]|jgi:hypothetical protein
MHQPVVLIEILPPTNVSKTRANVRTYQSIPAVAVIVVLHSTAVAAEVFRRGPDDTWPQQPGVVDAEDTLRPDSIGFAAPLRDACRTTSLAWFSTVPFRARPVPRDRRSIQQRCHQRGNDFSQTDIDCVSVP